MQTTCNVVLNVQKIPIYAKISLKFPFFPKVAPIFCKIAYSKHLAYTLQFWVTI